MVNKALLYGIIGFILGGLVVSTAAVTIEKDKPDASQQQLSTTDHNKASVDKLADLRGDDFDKAFIDEMISHHEGAIDMAKLIETNAHHQELKQLGKDIITAQSKEIDMMQTWQSDWGYKIVPKSHDSHE